MDLHFDEFRVVVVRIKKLKLEGKPHTSISIPMSFGRTFLTRSIIDNKFQGSAIESVIDMATGSRSPAGQ